MQVDAHVGEALFNEVFKGLLRDKTRILVTNSLRHLEQVDRVLVMHEGRIAQDGTCCAVWLRSPVLSPSRDAHRPVGGCRVAMFGVAAGPYNKLVSAKDGVLRKLVEGSVLAADVDSEDEFDEEEYECVAVSVVMWLWLWLWLWLCGCGCGCVVVALWLCGSVALWLCGCVAVWLCGCVAVETVAMSNQVLTLLRCQSPAMRIARWYRVYVCGPSALPAKPPPADEPAVLAPVPGAAAAWGLDARAAASPCPRKPSAARRSRAS